jgi:8-oxo-dGTP diphosphatase
VLIFLFNKDDVLLIQRSPRARLFPGMFNGVGGHIERGEDVLSAARREVREETGLNLPNLQLRCILHADEGPSKPGVVVFVFSGQVSQREVTQSSEGTLHWIPRDQIDQLNTLPDVIPLLSRITSLPTPSSAIFARSTISETDNDDEWQVHFIG